MRYFTIAVKALSLAVVIISQQSTANPLTTKLSSPLPSASHAPTPAGYIQYCLKNRADCRRSTPAVVALTPARVQHLSSLNARANQYIKAKSDWRNYGREDVWTLPKNGAGDCEDYALEKRRKLILAGWPQSALLLATAINERQENHVVLVVRTDQGDLVLDNLRANVQPWPALPYEWIAMQKPGNPLRWQKAGTIEVASLR